jgi:hypothetical protein
MLRTVNRKWGEGPVVWVCVQLVYCSVLSWMHEYSGPVWRSWVLSCHSSLCAPSGGQSLSQQERTSSWEPIPDESWFRPFPQGNQVRTVVQNLASVARGLLTTEIYVNVDQQASMKYTPRHPGHRLWGSVHPSPNWKGGLPAFERSW